MKIYIASSWKNQHAVELLTTLLRDRGHTVLSFVENNQGEQVGHLATNGRKPIPFDEWVYSDRGTRSFDYDTKAAMTSDLVVYIAPSGKDAAAEVGMAWAKGVKIFGLYAKGEDFGLMRRLIHWHDDHRQLIVSIDLLQAEMVNA